MRKSSARRATPLHIVDTVDAPRPRYARDGDIHTLKYPGELVLESDQRPVLIVREGGKMEIWNGREGRDHV